MEFTVKSPDEELAERIIAKLRAKNFISEAGLAKLQGQLAGGRLSAADWRLALEADRAVGSKNDIGKGQ
jgi:hypothetical protein